tara:strand:- start:10139 stop:10903 length:765 start_codon:yes stop_codon:yes gene_type:complete
MTITNLARSYALPIACLALPLTSALDGAVVSTPFSEDFSTLNSTTVASIFTETADVNWSIPTAGKYQHFTSLQNNAGSAMVTASGLGDTYSDFVVSTTFSVTSLGASGTSNWGLSLLGNDEDPGTFILADLSSSGTFRLINVGGSGTGLDVSASGSFSYSLNTSYTLTATGTYSGTDLTLSLEITDGVTTDSVTGTAFDASTHYTGSAMGLRARSGSGGGTTVQYDSFSIIPEPGSFALLAGFGMLGLVMLRRR